MSTLGQEIGNGAKAVFTCGVIGLAGGAFAFGVPCVIGALAGPVAFVGALAPCIIVGGIGSIGGEIYTVWKRTKQLPPEDKANRLGAIARVAVWSILGYKAGRFGFSVGALCGLAIGVGVLGIGGTPVNPVQPGVGITNDAPTVQVRAQIPGVLPAPDGKIIYVASSKSGPAPNPRELAVQRAANFPAFKVSGLNV